MIQVLEYELSELGCSATTCYIVKPRGQTTNGPCRCLDHIPSKDRIKVNKLLVERGYPRRCGETEDTVDLKSTENTRAGSSPASDTE